MLTIEQLCQLKVYNVHELPLLPFNGRFSMFSLGSSYCSGREPLRISGTGFFVGQISFLPPNHQW